MKAVLFACVGNSFRSQMAEGFARAYAKPGLVDARSGGTSPFGYVSPVAIRIMKEKGVDISRHESKGLDLAFAAKADAFVSLCGPLDHDCPAHIANRVVVWDVGEPTSASASEQRGLRDAIEKRVIELLESWGALRGGR